MQKSWEAYRDTNYTACYTRIIVHNDTDLTVQQVRLMFFVYCIAACQWFISIMYFKLSVPFRCVRGQYLEYSLSFPLITCVRVCLGSWSAVRSFLGLEPTYVRVCLGSLFPFTVCGL